MLDIKDLQKKKIKFNGDVSIKRGKNRTGRGRYIKKLYPAETAAFLEYPESLNTVSFFFFCCCVQSLCRVVSLQKKTKKKKTFVRKPIHDPKFMSLVSAHFELKNKPTSDAV